ncbi:MAG: S1 RNA-binding domain-containing protein [Oscillospiraceae bacterium]
MQHEVGKILDGKVTSITKFGAFIDLDGGGVGMVHISEISSTYVNDISEYLKEQQKVTVKILSISDDGKISLSIKKALPQPPKQPQKPGGFKSDYRANNANTNFSNGANRQGAGYNRGGQNNRTASSKPQTFEDMLSKFIQSSDEKISDMKKVQSSRKGSGVKPKNHRYDD